MVLIGCSPLLEGPSMVVCGGRDRRPSATVVEMVPPAGLEPARPSAEGRIEGAAVLRVSRSGTVQFTVQPRTRSGYMFTGSRLRRKGHGVSISPRSPMGPRPPTAISPALRNAPSLCGGVFISSTRPTHWDEHPAGSNPRDVCPFCITAALCSVGFASEGYSSPGPLSGHCVPGVAV